MPDLFYGDPVPLNVNLSTFSLSDWFGGKFGAKKIPHNPDTKVAAVGCCFGAKYVVRSLGDGSIDAGYIAYRATIEKSELEAVKGPLAIAAAEVDNIFPMNLWHESEAVLQKLGTPWQLNVYASVNYGFAVRCDLSDKRQKYAKESAFRLAL